MNIFSHIFVTVFLTDFKMDAKVESPGSPSRCKSLYDNGPVEWKTDVYYPFNTAYNNNNKASCTHVLSTDVG